MFKKNKYIRGIFIAALVLYWPGIFLLSHVQNIPGWIVRAQMSDKTMHFIGYMLLVYIWWNAISYSRRPGIKYYFTWVTLCLMALYGLADELLQNYTHRTPDITDFRADMLGVGLTLLIMWAFEIRVASAWIILIIMFTLTVLAHSDPFVFAPSLAYVFYFGGMAFASLLWLDYVVEKYRRNTGLEAIKFWFMAIVLPVAAFTAIFIYVRVVGREISAARLGAGLLGIICGIFTGMIISMLAERTKSNSTQNQKSTCSMI